MNTSTEPLANPPQLQLGDLIGPRIGGTTLPPTSDSERLIESFATANSFLINRKDLPSGAKLLTVETKLPHTFVGVSFNAGFRFEDAGQPGILHFFEHLPPSSYAKNAALKELLKTKLNLITVPDELDDLMELCNQRDWVPHIYITREIILFGFDCPTFDTAAAVTVIQGILNAPANLYASCTEQERSRIINEIKDMNSKPEHIISHFLRSISSQVPRDKCATAGTVEEVKQYSFDQIWTAGRAMLSHQRATFFVAGPASCIPNACEQLEAMPILGVPASAAQSAPSDSIARPATPPRVGTIDDQILYERTTADDRPTCFAAFRIDETAQDPKRLLASMLVAHYAREQASNTAGRRMGYFYRSDLQFLKLSDEATNCFFHFSCGFDDLSKAATTVSDTFASIAGNLNENSAQSILKRSKFSLLRAPMSSAGIQSAVVQAVTFPKLQPLASSDRLRILQELKLSDLRTAAYSLFGDSQHPKTQFTYWIPEQHLDAARKIEASLRRPESSSDNLR